MAANLKVHMYSFCIKSSYLVFSRDCLHPVSIPLFLLHAHSQSLFHSMQLLLHAHWSHSQSLLHSSSYPKYHQSHSSLSIVYPSFYSIFHQSHSQPHSMHWKLGTRPISYSRHLSNQGCWPTTCSEGCCSVPGRSSPGGC